MALTDIERTNIIKLVVGMFNAALGATYLAVLTVEYEANGRNLHLLADTLAGIPAYKSLNPTYQTASEFASALLIPLGLQNNQVALDFVTTKFNAGVSKGAIVCDVVLALDATTDTQFANAKAILNNKTAVAEYYSVTLGTAQSDIAKLQAVIAGVGKDAASVVQAETQLDNPDAVQSNTTTYFKGVMTQLTVGADTYVGTDGPDNVAGLAGDDVIRGGRGRDQLVGGDGNDTLYAGTFEKTVVTTVDIVETYSDNMSVVVGSEDVTTYVFDDAFSEWLYGGSGNDKLYGGYGSDVLDGGEGDDLLVGDDKADLAVNASSDVRKAMLNDSLVGGEGADTIIGGLGLDTIDLTERVSAKDSVVLMPIATATSGDADTITGFVSGVDTLTIDSAVYSGSASVVIGPQIAAGVTAAAMIAAITSAANTYAMAYYINNANGLSLAQIEAAVTAGSGATGETYFLIDNGADTLVYFDRHAETDAGSGAGMVLLARLVGVHGSAALQTGDLIG